MFSYPFIFPRFRGYLVRRLNRFVVEAEVNGEIVKAYLPNPGRLWELLLPGTELLLSPAPPANKLPYTVLACRKDNRVVLLHTHMTNKVIRHLIDAGRLEDFEDYRVIKEEPACGRHRFDLLLRHNATDESYYLEIKTCTLFDGRVAMFPDAVTSRGANHLNKLKELSAAGIKTGCLFAVMNPATEYFLPAYHIDFNFTRAFMDVKDEVQLKAVALGFDRSFEKISSVRPVAIPFDFLNSEFRDRGAYLLLIKMESEKEVTAGKLGSTCLPPGYYIYVGSAMGGISKRLARHARKRKQKRWHIDYLVNEADAVKSIPFISSDYLECELAGKLQEIAVRPVEGFGSSDCSCRAHLYYFPENPLHNHRFVDLIQYYRIRRLEKKLNNP